MVFKGFKQVVEQSGLTFENGYIYFVRTNDAKTEGYIYFNGKKYGNVSELRTELEAKITENSKIVSAALNDLQVQIDNINTGFDGRLDAAESGITALQGRMTTAESEINTVKGRVDTAEGDIAALDGRMTTAESGITALDGRLDAAESGITALDGRLDTAESGITALDGRLDAAESGITALQGRMTTAESEINTVKGRVDTAEGDIAALDGRMTTAESGITALDGRLDTAESGITALDGRLDTAESDISALKQTATNNKVTNFEYVVSGDSKELVITLGDGTKYPVDAKNFIKDGMLDSASLSEESGVTYLILTFNTDAGKQDIKLDVSTLIDIYTGDNKTIKVENNQISAIVDKADGLVSYNSFEALFTIGGDDIA